MNKLSRPGIQLPNGPTGIDASRRHRPSVEIAASIAAGHSFVYE
jgi:hypothetical protein